MAEGPFWVTFTIAGRQRRSATPDHENWNLEDLQNGFWVTVEHVLCRESQGQYWIPPAQIVLVEKRNQPPSPL